MQLTKLSLFSGISGDDLASEWAGIKTVCCVEVDPFCQKIIRKHYPEMPIIGDIHEVTKEKLKEVSGYEWVDIIAGGDPCQPRSIAGKRRGKADDRDLWSEMFRVICELKPTWVINENPTGRLSMDFHEVLSNLEGQGYETRAFVIPACAVNAPHRRERLFIVAFANGRRLSQQGLGYENKQPTQQIARNRYLLQQDATNSQGAGLERADTEGAICRRGCSPEYYPVSGWQENWIEVATSLCGVDDGIPNRVARLKALGNACVPQQVYPIYKAITGISAMRGRARDD